MKKKKRMFDYFEISEVKEVSEKNHKKLMDIIKQGKRTIMGPRKWGRTYKLKIDDEAK